MSSYSMCHACETLAVCLQGLHANLSTPTTLQIGARPFDEATLFEIGYAYEQLVSPMLCLTCWLPPTVGSGLQTARTPPPGIKHLRRSQGLACCGVCLSQKHLRL